MNSKVTLGNFGQTSDSDMIAAARRVVAARPEGQETAKEREFRLRPSGDTAGRIVYDALCAQRDAGAVPVADRGF